VVKLRLDRSKIDEDVSMIEFQIVQHGRRGPVMHELGPLIEKRRVVLVGFNNKMAAVGEAR